MWFGLGLGLAALPAATLDAGEAWPVPTALFDSDGVLVRQDDLRTPTAVLEHLSRGSTVRFESVAGAEACLDQLERLTCLTRLAGRGELLVVLQLQQGEQAVEVSALLVDLQAARARAAQTGRPADQVWLLTEAVVRTWTSADRPWLQVLEQVADDVLRRTPPLGRVALSGLSPTGPSVEVQLDDRTLGSVTGSVLIEHVRPGRRRVAWILRTRNEQEVTVLPGQVSAVELSPPPRDDTPRWLWGGFGGALMLAGSAVMVASAAQSPERQTYCFGPCGGSRFSRGGSGADGLLDPTQEGVPLFPIGAGLTTTGGSWLGTAIFMDRDQPPWWAILAGVGAGALVTGIAFAAEGSEPSAP